LALNQETGSGDVLTAPLAFAAFIAFVVGLVLLRRYAAGRVLSRDERWVWFLFPINLLLGGALLLIALILFPQAPVVSLAAAAFGLVTLALFASFVRRTQRRMRAAPPGADAADILLDEFPRYLAGMMVIGLIIGIGGGLLLGALAVMEGRG